jgi:hypothetical protein
MPRRRLIRKKGQAAVKLHASLLQQRGFGRFSSSPGAAQGAGLDHRFCLALQPEGGFGVHSAREELECAGLKVS